jgi:hypothetical protein
MLPESSRMRTVRCLSSLQQEVASVDTRCGVEKDAATRNHPGGTFCYAAERLRFQPTLPRTSFVEDESDRPDKSRGNVERRASRTPSANLDAAVKTASGAPALKPRNIATRSAGFIAGSMVAQALSPLNARRR